MGTGAKAFVLQDCRTGEEEVVDFYTNLLKGKMLGINATFACRKFREASVVGPAMQSFQLLASLTIEDNPSVSNILFKGGGASLPVICARGRLLLALTLL